MKKLRWSGAALPLLGLAALACGPKGEQVSDLSGLSTGQPGINTYTAAEPGESTVLERPYDIAPPLVPHAVDGLVISRTTNDCLDCHVDGDELDDGHVATKIPPSHFVNAYTGSKSTTDVVGNRYYCLQCHVPQADATFPSGKR